MTQSAAAPPALTPEIAARLAEFGHEAIEVELLLAHPTGFAEVWYGDIDGPRITLATDVVARTLTAKEYTAGQRMYGLVDGDLMYAFDMAAMGQQLQPHIHAQLKRRPRGIDSVGHRCPCGNPDVVTTEPRLPNGTPFPTTFYLTCPRAASRIGTLEGSHVMKEMQERLGTDEELAAYLASDASSFHTGDTYRPEWYDASLLALTDIFANPFRAGQPATAGGRISHELVSATKLERRSWKPTASRPF